MLAAILIAACSAASFALSTSFQHHAVEGVSREITRTHRVIVELAKNPLWLIGQAAAIAGFVLHAIALRLGALALVQPVVVSGVVLAIPARAALSRRLPTRSELATVSLAAVGLALFLVAADPSAGRAPEGHGLSVAVVTVGLLLAAAAALTGHRSASGVRAATAFGVASGVLFGLVAGLVKLTTIAAQEGSDLGDRLAAVATSWTSWGVVVVGLSGVVLNQRAYRVARLSASMPILNIVNVVVALAFGLLVFDETPAHGALAVVAQLVALVLVGVALRRLSRDEEPLDLPGEPTVTEASRSGAPPAS